MAVSELIAKLQQQDPAAVVVLWRNVDYEAVAEQVRELTPVSLRAFAAESCGWYGFWDESEVPPRTTARSCFLSLLKECCSNDRI